MPRVDSTSNGQKKIGSMKVKGAGLADVIYIGGSMFRVEFKDAAASPVDKELKFNIDIVKELISQNQLKLVSQSQFDEILAGIALDGSTKTHNADGTVKSRISQTVDGLAAEGFIKRDENGESQSQSVPGKRAHQGRTSSSKKTQAPSSMPFARPADEIDESLDQDPFAEDENFYDDDFDGTDVVDDDFDDGYEDKAENTHPSVPQRTPNNRQRQLNQKTPINQPTQRGQQKPPVKDEGLRNYRDGISERQKAGVPGDLNGDGVVDEMDKFVAEEQKKSPLLMGVMVISIIAAIGLFFIVYFLSANIFGNGTSLPSIGRGNDNTVIEGSDGAEQPSESDGADNSSGGNGNGTVERKTVVREDFDPETPVLSFPLADEQKEKIAIGMFQAIRQSTLNGDVNGFNAAVDIERIAGQLANGYANKAEQVQFLSEAEKNELIIEYQNTLVVNERQHVVDRDTYGSIFGGRIREVRQDPTNPNCVYVVMESIAGDHHRICYALNGNDVDGWTVTDALDADNYMSMIAKGK